MESKNYNLSFLSQKEVTILYLLKWQYFFWFWFTFFYVLYYIFVWKHIFNHLLKINPQLYTTTKSHGKWGDIIICLIPVFWCVNILTNSNILLKLLEWQTESSVLTIRVRGKQWYWLYKFDTNHINTDNSVCISFDKFLLPSTDLEENLNLLDLQSHQNFYNKYYESDKTSWNLISSKKQTLESSSILDPKTCSIFAYTKHIMNVNLWNIKPKVFYTDVGLRYYPMNSDGYFFWYIKWSLSIVNFLESIATVKVQKNKLSSFYHTQTLLKNPINLIYDKSIPNLRNFLNFSYSKVSILKEYQRRWINLEQKSQKSTNINDNIYNSYFSNLYSPQYLLNTSEVKKFSTIHNRRLLCVNQLLVLPINLPLTIITNSFDVVHSWFIPGLGIKMDCVPGRSTHHTLFIHTPGIYFGQCAEICGRFHHHMPIKICALPFSYFLLWWNHLIYTKYPISKNIY